MAKNKLGKEMLGGVSGGALGQTKDGKWAVLKNSGENAFSDNRTFDNINTAAIVAKGIGESTEYLTPDEIARRRKHMNPKKDVVDLFMESN